MHKYSHIELFSCGFHLPFPLTRNTKNVETRARHKSIIGKTSLEQTQAQKSKVRLGITLLQEDRRGNQVEEKKRTSRTNYF